MKHEKYTTKKIHQLLIKHRIEPARYNHEKDQLMQLGYTLTMAQRIILRRFSNRILATLIKVHHSLTTTEYNLNHSKVLLWDHESLTDIAAKDSGVNALFAIEKYTQVLLDMGYDPKTILSTAKEAGAKALEKIVLRTQELTNRGYPPAIISEIAPFSGSADTLDMLLTHTNTLLAMSYTPQDIVRMAKHDGGSAALRIVIKETNTLKNLGYTHEDIVKMASHGGAATALETVILETDNLKALGYSNKDIRKIAANKGGALTLKTLLIHTKKLTQLGYSPEDIRKVSAVDGGSKAVIALIDSTSRLLKLGYKLRDIRKMASQNSSAKILDLLRKHTKKLLLQGYQIQDIAALVYLTHSRKKLLEVIHFETLLEKHINEKELWSYLELMAKVKCGDIIFDKIAKYPAIKNYFFTTDCDGIVIATESFSRLHQLLLRNKLDTPIFPEIISDSTPTAESPAEMSESHLENDATVNQHEMESCWHAALMQQLTDLGYSAEITKKIILEKQSIDSAIVLLKLHKPLTESRYIYGDKIIEIWNHQRLSRIATNDQCSGAYELFAIMDHTQALLNLGYTPEDITNIAAGSGVSTLKILLNYTKDLQELGYELQDILKIALYPDSDQILQLLLRETSNLHNIGYGLSDILKIAAHPQGVYGVDMAIRHTPKLKELGYRSKDIVTIIHHDQTCYLLQIIEFEEIMVTELHEKKLWEYLEFMAKAECTRLICEKISTNPILHRYFFETPRDSEAALSRLYCLFSQHGLSSDSLDLLKINGMPLQEHEITNNRTIDDISKNSESAIHKELFFPENIPFEDLFDLSSLAYPAPSLKRPYEATDSPTMSNYSFFSPSKRHMEDREMLFTAVTTLSNGAEWNEI